MTSSTYELLCREVEDPKSRALFERVHEMSEGGFRIIIAAILAGDERATVSGRLGYPPDRIDAELDDWLSQFVPETQPA